MAQLNIVQAVNTALREEMRRDDRVVVLGEDVGRNGGVFRCTEGLIDEFPNRVFDTPLAEGGIVGTAIGMALYGLRPVPEIQFLDFIYPAFDQIVSEAAKMRYRSGGQYSVPMVIRAPYGGGIKGGHYHSQSSEAYFCHTPGLKVVIPSTPYDTKGLLISSIRDPDPVMFLEPKKIYRAFREEVPEGDLTVPLGKAAVRREGKDVSLIAWGYMTHVCLDAAKRAAEKGWECDVVDVRTLVPLDIDAIGISHPHLASPPWLMVPTSSIPAAVTSNTMAPACGPSENSSHRWKGMTVRPFDGSNRKAWWSHSSSELPPFMVTRSVRSGSEGSLTSKSDACNPKILPSLSASCPTPRRKSSVTGCRYAE